MPGTRPYHLITEARKPEFIERGYKGRYFFPHRAYFVTKRQPEQAQFARQFWSLPDPGSLYSVALFADKPVIDEFPDEVYFDRRIMMHRGHLGLPGLVATACLYVDGDKLFTDEHLCDLVTRCKFAGEHGNKIRRRFGGWHHMLLNSILHFANMRSLREIHMPNSARIQSQYVQREINMDVLERLYDRDPFLHHKSRMQGDFVVIDVQANRGELVAMERRDEPTTLPERGVSLFHDVTPGSEHRIEELLQAEEQLDIRSTYCVPASMVEALHEPIEARGHGLAFRSFDGRPYRQLQGDPEEESPVMRALTQFMKRRAERKAASTQPVPPVKIASDVVLELTNRLRRLLRLRPTLDIVDLCRDIDFYLTGFRVTDNDVSAGLTHKPLRRLHFDWVLDPRLDPTSAPRCEDGLVLFPVNRVVDQSASGDGFARLIKQAEQQPLATLGLPLITADDWLPRLGELVGALREKADVLTLQGFVDRLYLDRSM